VNDKAIRIPISKHLASGLVIVLVTFGIYANSLQGEFVWDDKTLFVEYYDIWQWKNVWQLLTIQDNLFRYNNTGFYRPLVNLTFLVDCWIWGQLAFGYHLTNIFFHILASITVSKIAEKISNSLSIGVTAGLIFALHPVHVEAVAWINGRNNLVSILFYMQAFLSYLRHRETGKQRYLIFSLAAIGLSIFSKEYAVTFPLLILLYEVACHKTGPDHPSVLRRIIPAWIGCLIIFTVYGAIRSWVIPDNAGVGFGIEGLGNRLLLLPGILTEYIKLLLLPVQLTPYHDIDSVAQVLDLSFIIPVAVMGGIGWIWLWSFRRSKHLFFAMGWIWITLLPVVNIIPIPFAVSLISERHLYMPSAGFCIMLALCLDKIKNIAFRLKPIIGRTIPLLLILLLFEFYTFETLKGNLVWRNETGLWQDARDKSPNNFMVRCNLAIAYAGKNRLIEGLREAQAAVRLNPTQDTPHYILGFIQLQLGWTEQAVESFGTVLAINPTHRDAKDLLAKIRNPDGI